MKEIQTERLLIRKAEQDIVDQINKSTDTNLAAEHMNSLAAKDIDIILQEKEALIDLVRSCFPFEQKPEK